MIKFWKSAAKGKSGCPVRPPEHSSDNSVLTNLLRTQIVDENEDTQNIFKKKSVLSLSLQDILIEKKALKYFLQFMETTDKPVLIQCWFDIEHFKTIVKNVTSNSDVDENYLKINRTKSLDLPSGKALDTKDFTKKFQRYSWREQREMFPNDSNLTSKNECSTSSCQNLTEEKKTTKFDLCDNKNIAENAVNLFKKYIALEALFPLDLPDNIRKIVISNICQVEGDIKGDCFKPVQELLYTQMESNYYNAFINSSFYIKAQIEILTNSSLNLPDILFNETILFYFTEYLEQESCRVLLEFLIAVTHFRDNLLNGNTRNSDQAQQDAVVLYDKYFSLQATNPVGFPTEIRLNIESNICREGGPVPDCFDTPYHIAFKTLTQYVKAFLQSEIYFKYLSEMIHSVNQVWSSYHKSLSDCSSEFSISTQNTLLAMGDPIFRKKKRHLSVPDMTIDSNQLYNADALWQRSRQEGLSLGRVNSLGRFESKFEPDPDKKDRSVLKKMVSKFVPMSASKVEEEMAWQIAHMIVKDVTDLTMSPPDEQDDV